MERVLRSKSLTKKIHSSVRQAQSVYLFHKAKRIFDNVKTYDKKIIVSFLL